MKHPYFYTREEEKWIVENVDEFENSIGLTKAFNEKFNKSKNVDAIKAKLHRLLPEHDYGWSGGQVKGFGISVTAVPIGTESWKGGYLYIKINDKPLPKNFTGDERKINWRTKHQWLWEQTYGEVPEGHIVIFLDGDRTNFNLDNLYCTSRKIQTVMMRNKWFSDNPEITLTAIKWAELHYAIKQQEVTT